MLNTPEFKVGMLVAIISVVIASMTLKVSKGPSAFSGQKQYYFEIDNAAGLVPNSAVTMAGIKIGTIDAIDLVDGRARVTLAIEDDVPVTVASEVEIRTQGILGDKGVELKPGDVTAPLLKSGERLTTRGEAGSLEQAIAKVSEIADSLSTLGKTLEKATTGDGDSTSPVGRIVLNVERVTEDLKDITGQNKQKVNDIMDRLADITETIDELVNDEGENGLRRSWTKFTGSLGKLESAINNIDEVTDKINNGDGTIGRLINDEETIDKLNGAIDNVNEFLGGAQDMQTAIDYHAEYLSSPSLTKSYLGFRIQPGLDRYYLIQVVDDPSGVTEGKETTTVIDGGSPEVKDETIVYRNEVKFSVMFGKNFYDFTVRGGILENSGGLGFDYYLFNRHLRLTLEAWDFSDTHVKAYAKYNIWKGVYAVAGVDDAADPDFNSPFFGAGLFLTNDDLKILASQFSFSGN
ncbi:MAG: organic solvent ABC transporter substrate-binding protein [Bdellovibrionaceae bacterium]|nr:organic solvent ABC transporter substrate-binding protein [Pseudobdellovibrionaceae bacterium]|tara:strand:- start:46849 stop:48237 length:1389 start_codon:yes stop_codon:yes gene_type:complete